MVSYFKEKARVLKSNLMALLQKMVFVFLLLSLIIGLKTIRAQAFTDTVVMHEYITVKKNVINTKVEIFGLLTPDNRIILGFLPEYSENGQILNPMLINKYELKYEMNPGEIIIEPSNYFKISSQDNKPIRLDPKKRVNITFDPIVDEFEVSPLMLQIRFKLSMGKDSKNPIGLIHLDLPLPDVAIVSSDDLDDENVPSDNLSASGKSKKSTQTQPQSGNNKQDMNKPEAGNASSTNQLRQLVLEAKQVYDQVHTMKLNMETVPVNQNLLQQSKFKIDQLRNNFDMQYMTGSFDDTEAASRAYSLFNEYHSTTIKLIVELSNPDRGVKGKTATNDEAATGIQEKKSEEKSNLVMYLFIAIAALVVIFVVVMLVMKIQKTKKSLDVQKQIQRKAQMELNKQKFQANQQKSKFKI